MLIDSRSCCVLYPGTIKKNPYQICLNQNYLIFCNMISHDDVIKCMNYLSYCATFCQGSNCRHNVKIFSLMLCVVPWNDIVKHVETSHLNPCQICQNHIRSKLLHFCQMSCHDDVMATLWPFVRGIHPSPVNSPHKGQRRRVFFDLRLNKRLDKL